MTEFQTNDIVRVELPRGYSTRGVLGVSLMFSTSMESKFEGAIGTITAINPTGPQGVHQYLVDFRTHDNSRVGIPWQAQWFREEWLALNERKAAPETPASKAESATSTWPTKPGGEADAPTAEGIAHPGAKLFTEGVKDFAPPGYTPEAAETISPEPASVPVTPDEPEAVEHAEAPEKTTSDQ